MKNALLWVWTFYIDGFRCMTLGRVLWMIILLKLFIMFCVLKCFFFPDFLSTRTGDVGEETYVCNELIQRALITEDSDM